MEARPPGQSVQTLPLPSERLQVLSAGPWEGPHTVHAWEAGPALAQEAASPDSGPSSAGGEAEGVAPHRLRGAGHRARLHSGASGLRACEDGGRAPGLCLRGHTLYSAHRLSGGTWSLQGGVYLAAGPRGFWPEHQWGDGSAHTDQNSMQGRQLTFPCPVQFLVRKLHKLYSMAKTPGRNASTTLCPHQRGVTSLDTVKSLLKVSQGRGVDAQVAALIARYVGGGGQLDKAALDTLATFRPAYLCFLRPEQLDSVQLSVLWMTTPQDLDACSPPQMAVLYHKAHMAFQNVSGSEYFTRIKPFLGGASTEDLRVFTSQNISIDAAAFKKLTTEAVLSLTMAEVQKLLGPNLVGLKAETGNMFLRDWISRQSQEDLDRLGLGLVGGVPNGYLVLDLRGREASSGGPHRLGQGPGPVLTVTASLLLVSVLS
ncbi:PREDICTED: mesothelin [Bison bison bison]|uniref:Mesothelin n=1 Tax=Bison bison bison TaxID=43346 RepID=A0A6P3IRG6_BISBB|nr:PREDICTED: mesothelin [Bison bison bison]